MYNLFKNNAFRAEKTGIQIFNHVINRFVSRSWKLSLPKTGNKFSCYKIHFSCYKSFKVCVTPKIEWHFLFPIKVKDLSKRGVKVGVLNKFSECKSWHKIIMRDQYIINQDVMHFSVSEKC